MKILLRVLLVALLSAGSPAFAQYAGTPRDGAISQALVNSYCVSLMRRGLSCTSGDGLTKMNAFKNNWAGLVTQGRTNVGRTAGSRDYLDFIMGLNKGLGNDFALGNPMWHLAYAKSDGSAPTTSSGVACTLIPNSLANRPARYLCPEEVVGGGGFGGGGAGVQTWRQSCVEAKINGELGILIVPGISLQAGTPIKMATPPTPIPDAQFAYGACPAFADCTAGPQIDAKTGDAVAKRQVHLLNMANGDQKDWYGVVRHWDVNQPNCVIAINVPYKRLNGTATTRKSAVLCNSGLNPYNWNETHDGVTHFACPQTEGSGAFHPYGQGPNFSNHMHGTCILYYPNPELGQDGYAINKYVSLDLTNLGGDSGVIQALRWMTPGVDYCPIDPAALAAVASALAARAGDAVAVPTSDARPGDTKVGDLGDNPDNDNSTANGGITDPPPTTPTTPTTPTAPSDTPPPSVGVEDPVAPTNIFTPVKDWLGLPEVTVGERSCPVWAINLTDYGGPSWQFLIDAHCTLVTMEASSGVTVGNLIRVVMSAFFVFMAGSIILRA